MIGFLVTLIFGMGFLCGFFMTLLLDGTETKEVLDHKIAMKIKGDLK
jgi:hypothetical protein